uniref:Uncharacterized protein n=1 Tax=Arundo donax TaxID=35708 RepID=A0A0A9BNQ7_ARUDO
MFILLQGK